MPEGDTIYRSAQRLRRVLPGAVVVHAEGQDRYLASESLVNAKFQTVEARGKHLLMHLADGRVLHSHMGMTGSWHLYEVGEPWRKAPRWASLVMHVRGDAEHVSVVVCFTPKTLELLTATQFRRHPYLSRLGPDLMLEEFPQEETLRRFRVHQLAPIGDAVMNQTIVCGIGNVYKSETLFLTGTNPFQPVGSLADDAILRIAETAQGLMRKNRVGHRRRTRISTDGADLWVYGRRGEPCLKCETPIRMQRQGDLGRSTYWCPQCQPSS